MFVRVILATLLVATASRGAAQSRPPLSPADIAEIVALEKIEDRRDFDATALRRIRFRKAPELGVVRRSRSRGSTTRVDVSCSRRCAPSPTPPFSRRSCGPRDSSSIRARCRGSTRYSKMRTRQSASPRRPPAHSARFARLTRAPLSLGICAARRPARAPHTSRAKHCSPSGGIGGRSTQWRSHPIQNL
jgi:hypothetical protein